MENLTITNIITTADITHAIFDEPNEKQLYNVEQEILETIGDDYTWGYPDKETILIIPIKYIKEKLKDLYFEVPDTNDNNVLQKEIYDTLLDNALYFCPKDDREQKVITLDWEEYDEETDFWDRDWETYYIFEDGSIAYCCNDDIVEDIVGDTFDDTIATYDADDDWAISKVKDAWNADESVIKAEKGKTYYVAGKKIIA